MVIKSGTVNQNI